MEDALKLLLKEATGNKHSTLRQSAQTALDLLQDVAASSSAEPCLLRERCLEPLQKGIESKSNKLALISVNGIQGLLEDGRFHTSMESEKVEGWLPMQVLRAIWTAPSLPEEVQVEILKMLLNMTFSTPWCMNAKVITKMSELSLAIYMQTSKQGMRKVILNAFLRTLGLFARQSNRQADPLPPDRGKVVLAMYSASLPGSVRTAVRATLDQLLTAIAERLRDSCVFTGEEIPNSISDFTSNEPQMESESLTKDIVTLLEFLCERLRTAQTQVPTRSTVPLLLDGVHAILAKVPINLASNQQFLDLVWQKLCPCLVSTLGNPLSDKSVTSQKMGSAQEDVGRGSGCSSSAPNIQSNAAKAIYGISVQLVRLVGGVPSLRPVLESLFHRILLYPPPVHRLEALKSIRELLNDTENLLSLAGPMTPAPDETQRTRRNRGSSSKKKNDPELSLLKLMVDAIQECCHCDDSTVCITSVSLINDLLTSVEHLVKGQGLSDAKVKEILWLYREQDGLIPSTPPNNERDFTDSSDSESDTGKDRSSESVEGVVLNTDLTNGDDHSVDLSSHDAEAGFHPKKLHDHEEIELKYRVRMDKTDFEEIERQCANVYVQELESFLPSLLESYSTYDADQLIQQFASSVCTTSPPLSCDVSEMAEHQCELEGDAGVSASILNADGVYLATYSALLLNLKLVHSGYFTSHEKSLPIAESQFVDDILNTGLLLYLTPAWLAQLFHYIINTDLLANAGFLGKTADALDLPALQLLTDVDGLESRKFEGQMLSTHREPFNALPVSDSLKLPKGVTGSAGSPQVNTPAEEAGQLFARRLVKTCWPGILDVLSVLINGKSACGITSSLAIMLNAKEESQKARGAICTSLEGLQKAARLTSVLDLQDQCGAVFSHLATASCVSELEDIKRERQQQPQQPAPEKKMIASLSVSSKPKLARLHAAHAFSMDVVLSKGLEMGSHSADCWPHVFRCCAHIAELEHTYFSLQGKHQTGVPKVQRDASSQLPADSLNDQNGCMDYYNSMLMSVEPIPPVINMHELLQQSSLESGWDVDITGGGVLKADQASKVLCGLSQEVDRLYEDAADKLNMKALVSFLDELCKSSRSQLAWHGRHYMAAAAAAAGTGDAVRTMGIPTTALHLYRLGDIVLKCVHGERPLLHIMKVWSVVAPHFVEAACHRDLTIAKKAVNCIHEVVTVLLAGNQELPHFHFHESLCKPFENLLCLELCDGDVQDQIVCSICELVEACASDIKSGWRSLFGALRAVRIEYTTNEEVNEARQRHVAAVLDVFEVFLNTDNVLVFSNAAVDCILCLLKYVRGPGEFESKGDEDSDSGSELPASPQHLSAGENLCLPALKYLEKCCGILSSMWTMPACPAFDGAHRITVDTRKVVDPAIPSVDLTAFRKSFNLHSPLSVPSLSSSTSTDNSALTSIMTPNRANADSKNIKSHDSGMGTKTSPDATASTHSHDRDADRNQRNSSQNRQDGISRNPDYIFTSLDEQDNQTGLLHVWYLVVEGLASSVACCPKNYQPQSLETLFSLMRSAVPSPGGTFALHCVNHLLLPTLQSWLRRGNQIQTYWDTKTTANFKQFSGLCTDLVVEYVVQFANQRDHHTAVDLMLRQLMLVLTECVAQPLESLSRLGCACIRHCLLSSGALLTEDMWQTAVLCLERACDVTLNSLQLLMTPFDAHSDNFYGDIGQVKVAVRRDCSSIESERLQQLAQQVFLLDSQKGTSSMIDYEAESDLSYIFLMFPPDTDVTPDNDHLITRVPFRGLVVSLLSHQLLMQTIGCLLLQGTSNMADTERSLMPSSPQHNPPAPSSAGGKTGEADSLLIPNTPLPGMLKFLSCRNTLVLLRCLYNSYHAATQFDARPGLKFLIQKVAKADVACNMYKQAGVSLTFYTHTLLEICSRCDNICVESVQNLLSQRLYSSTQGQGRSQDDREADESGGPILIDPQLEEKDAEQHTGKMDIYMGMFVCKLKMIFDEICTSYIDLYLDKEGPNAADKLSSQTLVFLLLPHDEIATLKRDKSIKEMVAEKLRSRKGSDKSCGEEEGNPLMAGAVLPTQSLHLHDFDMETSETTHSSPHSERASQQETDDRVYTVATDKTIKSLMSEYKKHKQVYSMPSFVKATRSKPAPTKPLRKEHVGSQLDPASDEIEEQQHNSLMKDSDAQLGSCVELVCSILQLLHQLPDHQHKALLPTIFPCLTQYICHSTHPRLRQALAIWTHRLGFMCGFAPHGDGQCPVPRLRPDELKGDVK